MKKVFCIFTVILVLLAGQCQAARKYKTLNQWRGRNVAFLGDSMTDKRHIGTSKNYWQYLEEMLGLRPMVYGINGHQWTGVMEQAARLAASGEDVDAIVIFAGTNDFNAGVPVGEWYDVQTVDVSVADGKVVQRQRRTLNMDAETFCGRINGVMSFLKSSFPESQIILLTPIHRAYARFSEGNVQPDESYANSAGVFFDRYVNALRQAAGVWAVPVLDLNSLSGLYPLCGQHARYFHDEITDMLHPNAEGHRRIAGTLMYQLLALPSHF